MSDNISIQNGIAEVFTAKTPAWHGLGITVSEAPTWQDASKLAHLDWTISKHRLLNPLTSDPIPSFAIVRDDSNKWISTVGEKYFPIQNSQCFEFCDALLQTGKVRYESAGALGNGETVWCLAKMDNDFEPVKGDVHETYLLFTDSRDGKAAKVFLTTVRVVCQNTLNMALSNSDKTMLKLRHTQGVTAKLEQAKALLTNADNQIQAINLKLSALARVKITLPRFETIMGKLFPDYENKTKTGNKAAIVASNFMASEFENEKGSAFAMLQAVTQYIDHQRDGLRVGLSTLETKRKESALFGAGNDFKQLAYNTICDVAGIEQEDDIEQLLHSVESV